MLDTVDISNKPATDLNLKIIQFRTITKKNDNQIKSSVIKLKTKQIESRIDVISLGVGKLFSENTFISENFNGLYLFKKLGNSFSASLSALKKSMMILLRSLKIFLGNDKLLFQFEIR